MDAQPTSSGKSVGLENLTPWPKGVSGNPAGKPKGTRSRATIVRQWLEAPNSEGGQVVDDVVKAAIIKAITTGDIPAMKELLDSAYGKVTDRQEITGADGQPIENKITVEFVSQNPNT